MLYIYYNIIYNNNKNNKNNNNNNNINNINISINININIYIHTTPLTRDMSTIDLSKMVIFLEIRVTTSNFAN